jgi:hypothetical protein
VVETIPPDDLRDLPVFGDRGVLMMAEAAADNDGSGCCRSSGCAAGEAAGLAAMVDSGGSYRGELSPRHDVVEVRCDLGLVDCGVVSELELP